MSRELGQRCSAVLAAQGKAYPRTCQVHGLRGCPKVVGENTKVREPDVPRSEVEGWRPLTPESLPAEGELAVFKSTAHGLVAGRVVYSDALFARTPKGVAGKTFTDGDAATFFRDVTHWLRLPDVSAASPKPEAPPTTSFGRVLGRTVRGRPPMNGPDNDPSGLLPPESSTSSMQPAKRSPR